MYTGPSLNSLTLVTEAFDCHAGLKFSAVGGATYRIKLEPAVWIEGATLDLSFVNSVPDNDSFGSAQLLQGFNGSAFQAIEAAGVEPGEPTIAGTVPHATTWFVFQPDASGAYTFDTCAGTNYDTVLGVFTGSSVGSLTELASNDDACGNQSSVSFSATANATYWIVVSSFNVRNPGDYLSHTLHWTAAVPANDDFANAGIITGATGTVSGNNYFASLQPGEPGAAATVTQTVWYRWLAPANGAIEFDTCAGSNFDTTLGAYTGGAVNTPTQRAFAAASCGQRSQTKFNATAGVT